MKKLFMLSLAALVFVPAVYAQQPAQTSEQAVVHTRQGRRPVQQEKA